jgi:yjeF C-terminal region, hydroxyethylthiazole kinase-related/yjeF N-terminal region
MRAYFSEEIRKMEENAEKQGILLARAMQSAGKALFDEISRVQTKGKIVILCGKGNNGGDGFVCANLLAEQNLEVTVILLCGEPTADLAKTAYAEMPETVKKLFLNTSTGLKRAKKELETASVILDAVFGFGFKGALKGKVLELISFANGLLCRKIAADIPSGIECDTGAVYKTAFQANVTVTFHALKPAHVSYPGKAFCGVTKVVSLNITGTNLTEAKGMLLTDEKYVYEKFSVPNIQSNKGDFGKLLLICGSYGMAGACIMAARAALRTGAGLVQIFTSEKLYPILASEIPEAVFIISNYENKKETENKLKSALEKSTACLTGCGLGEYRNFLCDIVYRHCKIPLVLDADALNDMAEKQKDGEFFFENPTLLTPHPGEMARLCGCTIADIQQNRILTAKESAKKYNAVVLLKGAGTVIANSSGKLAVNSTGNPGMAKGGSGDVLAGIISSLAAQGMDLYSAAIVGAYVHGKAGDYCAEKYSMRAMLPTDLIEMLPKVYLETEFKFLRTI